MNKVKKVLVLVLVVGFVSLGLSLTGCKKKAETTNGEHPGEHPSKETTNGEHPGEHPAGEHPAKEEPAKE